MNKSLRTTLIYLAIMLLIFAVAIPLTSHWQPSHKGILHGTLSLVFFGLIFNQWASLRPVTGAKLVRTILIVLAFILVLPLAINLVANTPILLKGILHLLVVALFLAGLIYVWRDPRKY